MLIKEGTFHKELQAQLRDEVVGALSTAIAERDLEFWKRQSQNDWSQGEGQEYFSNASRYSKASSLDVHLPGQLRLVAQPTQLKAATGALNGRGGVLCAKKAFFPWTDGNYAYCDNTLTVSTSTGPVGMRIGDIVSDGTNVFFAVTTSVNIYTTTGAAPGVLAAYDASGSLWGHVVYDQLNKILYAAASPITGLVTFKKINAGGAATAIYDFVTGRIDALEMHLGSVIIAWNDAQGTLGGPTPTVGSAGRSRLFKYDGSAMTVFADLPNGTLAVGLRSAFGTLFVTCLEADPLDAQNAPPAYIFAIYAITGSTITRLGTITGTVASDPATSLMYIGSHSVAVDVSQHIFLPAAGFCWRYDLALGGLSRSLGDDGIPGISGFTAAIMSSLVFMDGGGLLCEYGGGNSTGGIYNLNGTINGITPSSPAVGTAKLTSSRIDGGLPYVPKFWYDIQSVFTALVTGESVQMEYSLDDGTTWATCTNSPASTVGTTQANFTVQQSNPHIRYRVRPVAAAATKGPTIFSVSCRYAVANPNASVYRFTASCVDDIRARNNAVVPPGYGKDALAFFDNIARENKVITFYEPDDSTRTAHSVWVMSMTRPMPNTSSVYDINKAEGDVEIVLWETTG